MIFAVGPKPAGMVNISTEQMPMGMDMRISQGSALPRLLLDLSTMRPMMRSERPSKILEIARMLPAAAEGMPTTLT